MSWLAVRMVLCSCAPIYEDVHDASIGALPRLFLMLFCFQSPDGWRWNILKCWGPFHLHITIVQLRVELFSYCSRSAPFLDGFPRFTSNGCRHWSQKRSVFQQLSYHLISDHTNIEKRLCMFIDSILHSCTTDEIKHDLLDDLIHDWVNTVHAFSTAGWRISLMDQLTRAEISAAIISLFLRFSSWAFTYSMTRRVGMAQSSVSSFLASRFTCQSSTMPFPVLQSPPSRVEAFPRRPREYPASPFSFQWMDSVDDERRGDSCVVSGIACKACSGSSSGRKIFLWFERLERDMSYECGEKKMKGEQIRPSLSLILGGTPVW